MQKKILLKDQRLTWELQELKKMVLNLDKYKHKYCWNTRPAWEPQELKNAPQFGKIQTQILLKDQTNLRATRVKKCSSIWTNTNKNFAERPGNLRATKNGPQFGQALSDAEWFIFDRLTFFRSQSGCRTTCAIHPHHNQHNCYQFRSLPCLVYHSLTQSSTSDSFC